MIERLQNIDQTHSPCFKSGFAALVGRPNVGKSSLMNALLGQKLAIISDKPQTTRNQWRGVITGSSYQIVLIDTPGLHRPFHQLGEQMIKTAQTALSNVDLVLWVLDASMGFTPADQKVGAIMETIDVPLFAVWNKADLIEPEHSLPELPGSPRAFQISAVTREGLDKLLEAMKESMPEGPEYFPPDFYTDHPERVIAAELIREPILRHTQEEVPHSVAVQVEEWKERPDGRIYINAVVYVERDTQKGIIIGAGGERLKTIGQEARAAIELMVDAPVYLELWVKVWKNWRNNPRALRELGLWDEKK